MLGKNFLGKNSPLSSILTLSSENYEALIERHGQRVRWMRADKCPCVLENGRSDPNCQRCNGNGWNYHFQLTRKKLKVQAKELGLGAYLLPPEDAGELLSVEKLSDGRFYSFVGRRKIVVSGTTKGKPLFVDYRESLQKTQTVQCLYQSPTVLQIPNLQYEDGTFFSVEILFVKNLVNHTTNEAYTVRNRGVDDIEIEPPLIPTSVADVVSARITYVEYPKFLLLSQNLKTVDQEFLQNIGGDAIAIFPDEFHVGEGDVITTLSGTSVRKTIRTRSSGDTDAIPEFFISEIISISDALKTYIPDEDFSLLGNKILWKNERPATGENFFLSYRAYPTYRVMQDLPGTRSSEGKSFPRRVALKLFSMGGNAREGLWDK